MTLARLSKLLGTAAFKVLALTAIDSVLAPELRGVVVKVNAADYTGFAVQDGAAWIDRPRLGRLAGASRRLAAPCGSAPILQGMCHRGFPSASRYHRALTLDQTNMQGVSGLAKYRHEFQVARGPPNKPLETDLGERALPARSA